MDVKNRVLWIGKTYIVKVDKFSRLCADIRTDKRGITLWFAVDSSQEEYLCVGRADAFVVALLPMAMRGTYDIVCEDPMSERLLYQLNNYLIPMLASTGIRYHRIHISAVYTKERYSSQGAAGTGFSGGVDCLYTIMRHGVTSEYPLDYIAVFNTGNIEKGFGKEAFWENYKQAVYFANEQKMKAIYVDTNFWEALPEDYSSIYSFRNLSCALALQGLFSVYLLSSAGSAKNFKLKLNRCNRYDLLTINCMMTESISFYLSGTEVERWEKIEALTEWVPSYNWLHPCTAGIVGQPNCGHCRKCIRDLTVLYALGKLERYESVFDIEDYLKHFPERIAFVLARTDSTSCKEIKLLLQEKNISIPKAAYVYERQFSKALQSLKASQENMKRETI